jgi:hypothetical protein
METSAPKSGGKGKECFLIEILKSANDAGK